VLLTLKEGQLAAFRDGTGLPFAVFMNSLLRAAAAVAQIPHAAIHTTERTNLDDGGVDAQIDVPGEDVLHRLHAPTCWQYKAVCARALSKEAVRNEILGKSKIYVRTLLERRYAYALCICDSDTPEIKAQLSEWLNSAIREVNPDAPTGTVLLSSDIASWAGYFPAIVASVGQTNTSTFQTFESWKRQITDDMPTFVPTEQSDAIREEIALHLDWTKRPSTDVLSIFGDAGVGKTRCVFEALGSIENQRHLVLYTADEYHAVEIAHILHNDETSHAILVADECLSATSQRLKDTLRSDFGRVRVISIDNACERISGLPELNLLKLSSNQIVNILKENYQLISIDRLNRYADISDGFLRFALFLCRNNDQIESQGYLGNALSDARSYIEKIFAGDNNLNRDDLRALQLLALVSRVGYRDSVAGELKDLCTFLHLNPHQTKESLENIRRRTGLVSNQGRYYYVTPTLVAMLAFESAWERWFKSDPEMLAHFPETILDSFLERVTQASHDVKAAVARFFDDRSFAGGLDTFQSEIGVKRFLTLMESYPDTQIATLERIFRQAGADNLTRISSYARRMLIPALLEVARFPEYFKEAEGVLFRLAETESEPNIGNNASKSWEGLFYARHSGTAISFEDRWRILVQRFTRGSVDIKALCLSAATAAGSERGFRIVGLPMYGNRIPPPEWAPKTWGELHQCFTAILTFLRDATYETDKKLAERANEALLGTVSHLLFGGLLDQVREPLRVLPNHLRPRLRALLRQIVIAPDNDPSDDAGATDFVARKKAFLISWIEELRSSVLHDILVEEIGPPSWDHYHEEAAWQGRIDVLANRLLENRDELVEELPFLDSKAAGAASDLGMAIGRLDRECSLLQLFTDNCIKTGFSALITGYVGGRCGAPLEVDQRTMINRAIDALSEADPILGFAVMLPAGDAVGSFARAIRGVASGVLPTGALRSLAVWNGGRRTNREEMVEAVNLLRDKAELGDESAAAVALEFLQFRLMNETERNATDLLQEVFAEDRLETVLNILRFAVKHARPWSHAFSRIFQIAAPASSQVACSIVGTMLTSKEYAISQEGESVLSFCAEHFPGQMMSVIGELMLSKDNNAYFYLRKFPLSTIPDSILEDWIKVAGIEGARVLVRHLPGPYVAADGPQIPYITNLVLEKYGNDQRVFSAFVAGIHSFRSFTGSLADVRENDIAVAELFRGSANDAIARWAEIEIASARRQSDEFRIFEAEEGFP
jgi:hypothetical protein